MLINPDAFPPSVLADMSPGKLWYLPHNPTPLVEGLTPLSQLSAMWDDAGDEPVDQVQKDIEKRIVDGWAFMSDDELRGLQAQCAVIGHYWPDYTKPSMDDPLGQIEYEAKRGTPCTYCRLVKP